MSSAIINNNFKLFMNMHDGFSCGLISHITEASLFKCFLKGIYILKPITFLVCVQTHKREAA